MRLARERDRGPPRTGWEQDRQGPSIRQAHKFRNSRQYDSWELTFEGKGDSVEKMGLRKF